MSVPKNKKRPTPEEVALNESMRTTYKKRINPYPKKKKDNNHTMTKSAKTKYGRQDPLFVLDIKTMRQRPVSMAYLEQLALKLVEWVNTKKEVIIDEFLQQEGYSYGAFKRFRNRCPKLEEAYQYAKMCIGNKRERGALYNKMNANIVMKSMPNYSERWANIIKLHAEVNQKQNINQGVQIVEIPAAEKTDIVPPLNQEDKEE